MELTASIVITGAAGFIGSYFIGFLNQLGFQNLILVDDFSKIIKEPNLKTKKYSQKIDRNNFLEWCNENASQIDFIFHLGARTDTTEMNYEVHKIWNLDYSKALWSIATKKQIPFLYASSAATYGNGSNGYDDDESKISLLTPLNPYGLSKQQFDIWVLEQKMTPPFWAGLKFFNVYGPNEYHKGRMASVILHAYKQIQNNGSVKLFKSHQEQYSDGGQMRDFIYVKDVVNMCFWLMNNAPNSGIYNIGTGKARTFNDLVNSIFNTLKKPSKIEYIDTPIDIRANYQYFTEANMQKLISMGYSHSISSIEEGIFDYVTNYLKPELCF